MSYIASVIAGEREVIYKGKERKTEDVYTELGIEPYVFKELPAIISGLPVMLKKRRFIQSNKKISHKRLRKYFDG